MKDILVSEHTERVCIHLQLKNTATKLVSLSVNKQDYNV